MLRREFSASRQRVFRAWTESEALERWLRPKGRCMTVTHLDVRVGGSFRFDVEDGSAMIGTYLHITPPEKLVFTWSGEVTRGHETIVTLDFVDQGPVTELVLTHEGICTPDMRLMFGSGWPSMLDTLARVLPLAAPDALFE